MGADTELLTLGHGKLSQIELTDLLRGAGLEVLVDVRTAPGSRRHPHVARPEMENWLPDAGIAYVWEPRLGGWRKPDPDSANIALRNDSFRGYADYMRSAHFWDALDSVLDIAARKRAAVMCSEAVYWRCHRRLIADAASIGRDAEVLHVGHDGAVSPHRLTDGVRQAEGGLLYDLGTSEQLL